MQIESQGETLKGKPQVCLFFFVKGEFLIYGCSLEAGEAYGDFINYPQSHFDVWNEKSPLSRLVDFDYYPRGRVVYRKPDDTYLIYYDKCIESQIPQLLRAYAGKKYELNHDEHYQCHRCNRGYVTL